MTLIMKIKPLIKIIQILLTVTKGIIMNLVKIVMKYQRKLIIIINFQVIVMKKQSF